jgi:hypothetical protein
MSDSLAGGESSATAAAGLVSTRISRREHRPRRLQVGNHAGSSPDGHPGATLGLRLGGAWKPSSSSTYPRAVFPRHVRACQHSPHVWEKWFVWTWPRDRTATQTRVPYSCGSWRCSVCRRYEASVTFARIKQATSRGEYSDDGWVFMVLTLDRDGYYSGRPWPDVTGAYRALSAMTDNLLHRLRRAYNGEPRSSWVGVVEAHRSGWPHINLMLYAPELARELRQRKSTLLDSGSLEREARLLGGELLRHATECGWGRQSTAEAAHSTDALAGYIVKLAGQHDDTMGELAKITQAPMNAPQRFRRLRSGKGFLPPRKHNPNITGVLIRRRRASSGEWEVPCVNPPKDEAQTDAVHAAVRAELALIEEEETLLSIHRVLPPMPPLRHCMGGKVAPWNAPQRAPPMRDTG